jgi:hypothetical protein
MMIMAAHTLEAHRLSGRTAGAGKAAVSCDSGMSTQTYRRRFGVASGMDVDHIVPRSLGGADHPANYRVIPASLNRSLGNVFDAEKCTSAGLGACAIAVVVSVKCGAFRGGLPAGL